MSPYIECMFPYIKAQYRTFLKNQSAHFKNLMTTCIINIQVDFRRFLYCASMCNVIHPNTVQNFSQNPPARGFYSWSLNVLLKFVSTYRFKELWLTDAQWFTTVWVPLYVLPINIFRVSLLRYLHHLWTSSSSSAIFFSLTFLPPFFIFICFSSNYFIITIYFLSACTPEFSTNICFLLLKVLSSDEIRVSCLQAHTLDWNEFFLWANGQKFASTTNLLERAGDKADKRYKEYHFTSSFSAMERKTASRSRNGADA